MRSNRTKGLLAQMLVVVSLLLGFVAFAGTTAEAQYRSRGRIVVRPRVFVYPRTFYPRTYYPRSYYYNRVYIPPTTHVTESQGFRDGLNDGRDDAEEGKGYRPESHNSFRNAQTSAYLDGFRRGYDEGYRSVRGD
jgi:hypothetical protein